MLQQVTAIAPIGWYHLLAFGLIVPALAIRSRMTLKKVPVGTLNRVKHFQSTAITLVLFGGLSFLTARDHQINLFRRPFGASLPAAGAAAAMYVAAVMVMRPRWRRAVEQRNRIVHLFMPSNARERAWWTGVSILAGISEEITWRGVHPILLAALLGSPAGGVALAALTFALGHMTQGWKTSGVIVLFAAGFQTLVWLSGSLYLAMLVHIAYDITAGLTYGHLGKKLGYTPDDGLLQRA